MLLIGAGFWFIAFREVMSGITALVTGIANHVLIGFLAVLYVGYRTWHYHRKTRHDEKMRRHELREKEIEEYGSVVADGRGELPDYEREEE